MAPDDGSAPDFRLILGEPRKTLKTALYLALIALIFLVTVQVATSTVYRQNLTHYWTFNDTTYTDLVTPSTWVYSGGAPLTQQSGVVSYALGNFTSSKYLKMTRSGLEGTSQFCLGLWGKTKSINTYSTLLDDNTTTHTFDILTYTTTQILMLFPTTGMTWAKVIPYDAHDGQYHFFAMSFTKNSKGIMCFDYHCYNNTNASFVNYNLPSYGSSFKGLTIGYQNGLTGREWNGLVDEFFITNKTGCTYEELQSMYYDGYSYHTWPLAPDAPTITYWKQSPADLNVSNIFTRGVNITYNISDGHGVNDSTVRLYYKTNNSKNDITYYVKGTAYTGWFSRNYTSKTAPSYQFNLYDNQLLPASYNAPERTIETTPISGNYTLNNTYYYVGTKLLNVSNVSRYGFFEIMANRTVGSGPLVLHYCNSSFIYTFPDDEKPENSPYCVEFATITSNGYDHRHTASSAHNVVPFAVNTSTGRIGNVKITGSSWIIAHTPNPVNTKWSIFPKNVGAGVGLNNSIILGANSGNNWAVGPSNGAVVIDAHLHQFRPNTTFRYYVCANDSDDSRACSTIRSDALTLYDLPPISPGIYSPDEASYLTIQQVLLWVNYTASISPSGYAINSYNISLYNATDGDYIAFLHNNSNNLSWFYNASSLGPGDYYIVVEACDVKGRCAEGISGIISIRAPYYGHWFILANLTILPYNLTLIINGSSSTQLVNVTAFDSGIERNNNTNVSVLASKFGYYSFAQMGFLPWSNTTVTLTEIATGMTEEEVFEFLEGYLMDAIIMILIFGGIILAGYTGPITSLILVVNSLALSFAMPDDLISAQYAWGLRFILILLMVIYFLRFFFPETMKKWGQGKEPTE